MKSILVLIWSMYFRLTSADSEGRHIMKFRKTYKRKQAAVLLSVFLLVTSVAGCQRVGAVKETGEEKVNVVTTIFPQYDFVRQIAGDNVEVSMQKNIQEKTGGSAAECVSFGDKCGRMSESGGCERDRRRESKCRDNHFSTV